MKPIFLLAVLEKDFSFIIEGFNGLDKLGFFTSKGDTIWISVFWQTNWQ
jgi:hypothetical protein